MENTIDFIMMWVDGSDPVWLAEKAKYSPSLSGSSPDQKISDHKKCFRDWDLLQYWFRGVEVFAPWVRKIHFVTYGHLPAWLNTDAPKLNIVRHSDFMPDGSLPTYNSRALETNFHRIKGLSEQFVYFNDDMFLISPTVPEDFFSKGLPRDCAVLSPIKPERYGTGAIQLNNLRVIDRYFHGYSAIREHYGKWITPVYGANLLRTLMFLPMKELIGFYEPHLPVSYSKATYDTVWEKEPGLLYSTALSRFKKKDNINHWLMRDWQLASGNFIPRSPSFGKFYDLSYSLEKACDTIRGQKRHMVCLNDSAALTDEEMDRGIALLNDAFSSILPDKSVYEK